MDLGSVFDDLASAMVSAANVKSVQPAQTVALRHGLNQLGDGTPSQNTVWEKTDQGSVLRFRWRWYDQSQAFSIRPDMNVLTLELWENDQLIRKSEQRFED